MYIVNLHKPDKDLKLFEWNQIHLKILYHKSKYAVGEKCTQEKREPNSIWREIVAQSLAMC